MPDQVHIPHSYSPTYARRGRRQGQGGRTDPCFAEREGDVSQAVLIWTQMGLDSIQCGLNPLQEETSYKR